MTIPFSAVVEGDRARQQKNYGDLSGLKKSIQEVGLIQPIVLARTETFEGKATNRADYLEGDKYVLVAGGRRFRSMKELGVKELHHGSTLDPAKLGFVFSDEVPEDKRLEAELDENLHRLGMTWIDNAILIYRIHRAKKDKDSKWGQRQTAELVGNRGGTTTVNYSIRAAQALLAGDKEILSCGSLDEANCVFIKRKEESALAELTRRATEKIKNRPQADIPIVTLSPNSSATSSFLDDLADYSGPAQVAVPQAKPSSTEQAAPVQIPLSVMFTLGDSMELQWPSVDHIVTDIPYGIDMDNLDPKQIEDVKDQHDVAQNVSMMQRFLAKAFEAVKPGGFCVFTYDLDHHEKLQQWAEHVGWRVQSWPYVICKSSPCQNNAAQYNTTKNYEVAMFLRKDSQTVLRKPVTSSWKIYDFAAERRIYNNPFAKPLALWKDLYEAISFPGQSVLDPFCGEMSACRAAANCGLLPYGIEINEKHYARGLVHMKGVYALVHAENCEFI